MSANAMVIGMLGAVGIDRQLVDKLGVSPSQGVRRQHRVELPAFRERIVARVYLARGLRQRDATPRADSIQQWMHPTMIADAPCATFALGCWQHLFDSCGFRHETREVAQHRSRNRIERHQATYCAIKERIQGIGCCADAQH